MSNASMGIAWILTAVRRKRWSYGFKIRWSFYGPFASVAA